MRQYAKCLPFFAAVALVPLAFQNCSGALEEEKSLSSLTNNAPFAFELNYNLVSSMSCRNTNTSNNSPLFSFRVSATGANTGIRIRDEFWNYVDGLSEDEIKSIIAQSPANANTRPSLTYRSVEEYRVPINFSSGNQEGLFAFKLSDPETVSEFLAQPQGTWLKNIRGLNLNLAIINYTTDIPHIFRDYYLNGRNLGSNGFLGVTFKNSSPGSRSTSPAPQNAKRAFGQGYFLFLNARSGLTPATFTFNPGSGAPIATINPALNRILASESFRLDLTEPSPFSDKTTTLNDSGWRCRNLLIIRNGADSGRTECGSWTGSYSNATDIAAIRAALNDPSLSTWRVSNNLNCIQPKAGQSCYKNNAVNYSGSCNKYTCPAYLSVCQLL